MRFVAVPLRIVADRKRFVADPTRIYTGSTRFVAVPLRIVAAARRFVADPTRIYAGSTRFLAGSFIIYHGFLFIYFVLFSMDKVNVFYGIQRRSFQPTHFEIFRLLQLGVAAGFGRGNYEIINFTFFFRINHKHNLTYH